MFVFEGNKGPAEGKEVPVAARSGVFRLPHGPLRTPIFMPVATQGALKGITVEQLEEMEVEIILGNTYHLGLRPGESILRQLTDLKNKANAAVGVKRPRETSSDPSATGVENNMDGIHFLEDWRWNILTDSGGFQMVSLLKLAKITEEGVRFQSTHGGGKVSETDDDSKYSLLLRPEDSIRIQNAIGGDIMMQLDDVVHTLTTGPRVEEAMWRSVRWLDRCIAANQNESKQCIFGIIQGGLIDSLRRQCVEEMVKRTACKGFAIGGLSGGEEKEEFWKVVRNCVKGLPEDKPRYCMGVGYPEDILVCIALGVDMFDCVYACRTARFGTVLTSKGNVQLGKKQYATEFGPIDAKCPCKVCKDFTRAYLHKLAGKHSSGATLLSYHNIAFLIHLTRGARRAIEEGRFTSFVQDFFEEYYEGSEYPTWIVNALASVDITLRPLSKKA